MVIQIAVKLYEFHCNPFQPSARPPDRFSSYAGAQPLWQLISVTGDMPVAVLCRYDVYFGSTAALNRTKCVNYQILP